MCNSSELCHLTLPSQNTLIKQITANVLPLAITDDATITCRPCNAVAVLLLLYSMDNDILLLSHDQCGLPK